MRVYPLVKVGIEKPWWSPAELNDLRQQCIDQTHLWRQFGCPRSGSINDARIVAKFRYKQAIKEVMLVAEVEFNDDLVNYVCRKKIVKVFGRVGKKVLLQ